MFVSRALSAVNYPKASSLALACYEWLQGTAGGVGESSGWDYPEVADSFLLRHRNPLHCSCFIIRRAQVA